MAYEFKSAFFNVLDISNSWLRRAANRVTNNRWAKNPFLEKESAYQNDEDRVQAHNLYRKYNSNNKYKGSNQNNGNKESTDSDSEKSVSFIENSNEKWAEFLYRKTARKRDWWLPLAILTVIPLLFMGAAAATYLGYYASKDLVKNLIQIGKDVFNYLFDFKKRPYRSSAFLLIAALTIGLLVTGILAATGVVTLPFLAAAAGAIAAELGTLGLAISATIISIALIAAVTTVTPAALSLLNIVIAGIAAKFDHNDPDNENRIPPNNSSVPDSTVTMNNTFGQPNPLNSDSENKTASKNSYRAGVSDSEDKVQRPIDQSADYESNDNFDDMKVEGKRKPCILF